MGNIIKNRRLRKGKNENEGERKVEKIRWRDGNV